MTSTLLHKCAIMYTNKKQFALNLPLEYFMLKETIHKLICPANTITQIYFKVNKKP